MFNFFKTAYFENLNEFRMSNSIKLLYYFAVFNFFVTFSDWLNKGYLSKGNVSDFTSVCPPYFQSCLNFHIFNSLPLGYSLSILYAGLGSLLFISIWYSLIEKWEKALIFLLIPLLFKIIMVYFLSYYISGNYTVIEIAVVIVLLLSKDRIFSLKILLSALYFFSAIIKVYPGYLQGNLFNTLELGLPLLPQKFNEFYSIFIVTFFLASSILIWNKNRLVKKVVFALLFIFHIYTQILVGFRFPEVSIILLFVVYISEHKVFSFVRLFKETSLCGLLLFFALAQFVPLFINGDSHITGEGERYGFYIFNTNKQCVLEKIYNLKTGERRIENKTSTGALYRCDPYEPWFVAQQECLLKDINSIEFKFSISLNGSPYFKVVDEKNICNIKNYKPFSHNEWIKEGLINDELKVYKNSI